MSDREWKASELSCDPRGDSEQAKTGISDLVEQDIDDGPLAELLARQISTEMLREARENDDVSSLGSDTQ